MIKKATIGSILFALLVTLLAGCAGKGKDVKSIKGDPEILYRQGLERFNKRDYSEALKIFEQVKSNFPDSPPFTQWAEIKVGDCHFFMKEYVEAIAAYEEFKKTRPTHEDIPYVQYQIGMSYFQQMLSPDRDQTPTRKALSNFEFLVSNMPPSLFTEKAEEKMEVCKKRLADHEFYIGNFYYKQGKYLAAAQRFEGLLNKFPNRSGEDKTLYLLGKSRLELNQWEKAYQAFSRLVDEYPKSPHSKEARSILDQGRMEKGTASKTKAKEAKKKAVPIEGESGRITMAKFDEERRQPVQFKEKREVSLPAGESSLSSVLVPKAPAEDHKEISPSLVRYEEERRRPLPPSSPPPPEEIKLEAQPENEPRKATLPPAGSTPLTKESPPAPVEKVRVKQERPEPSKEVQLGDPSAPIDITSDRVEALFKENRILFQGNVMARQKDIVIYSDFLEATILEDGKGIEKVVAGGNVKVQQGLRVANCQKAIFYNQAQRVVLTGNPKVWEGENQVSGEEIIFDIVKNRIEVKGGSRERGKVRVIPGEEVQKLK